MLYDLNEYQILIISGLQASQLLQGQLTCDVLTLVEDKAVLGAHCNRQGRVISLFYIIKHQDTYLLVMPQSLIAITANALKKYALFYKVNMDEINNVYHIAGNDDPTDSPILLSNTAIATVGAYIDWKQQCLKAGIANIYPETVEKFLPHELNLPNLNAVSFNKGCYTGQEIIARMHYRGKCKKQLCYITLISETKPILGEPWHDQGELVDAVQLTDNEYAALLLRSVEGDSSLRSG